MFFGIAIFYLDRVNISHTIISISVELGLTKTQQGLVMSSFSFGYVSFMLISGVAIARFGIKWIVVITTLLLSIATIFSGFVNSFCQLFLARFLVGVFESPIFPANAKIVATEFKESERGRATALFDSGSYVGASLAAPFIIYIIIKFDWRYAFYISGIIGIIWCFVWFALFSEKGEKLKPGTKYKNVLRLLITNKTILLICSGFFCYNYLKSFYLTWFPSFLVQEKGFSFMKTGVVAMIPPIFAIGGEYVVGYIMDDLQKKGYSLKVYRIIPLCIGLLCSSIIIFSLFFNNPIVVTIIFTLSYMFLIGASPAIWAIPSDISPNNEWISIIGGLQNTFSNIAGIVAPIITGVFLDYTKSFYVPIIFSAIIAIFGALFYFNASKSLKSLHP